MPLSYSGIMFDPLLSKINYQWLFKPTVKCVWDMGRWVMIYSRSLFLHDICFYMTLLLWHWYVVKYCSYFFRVQVQCLLRGPEASVPKSKSEKKVCLCSLLLFFLPPQSHLQAKALHSCPIIYPQNALWGIRTKGKKKAWMYGKWRDLSCCFSCSLLSVSKAFSMC